jgi:SAM-dependent methyltransferase
MKDTTELLKKKYGFEYPLKPDRLSRKALTYVKSGKRLLDAGCREGADSIFFARKGFHVTAIDSDVTYLKRFRTYIKDHRLSNISVSRKNLTHYPFPLNTYDVICCLLVGCCMKKSDFEKMLVPMKRSVKPGGIVIMSLRNYLDPEYKEYLATEKMIEPNTFKKKDDCCKIRYYIEKGRLRQLFADFEILYYYEGLARDKYQEVPKCGDSYVICRRIKTFSPAQRFAMNTPR